MSENEAQEETQQATTSPKAEEVRENGDVPENTQAKEQPTNAETTDVDVEVEAKTLTGIDASLSF